MNSALLADTHVSPDGQAHLPRQFENITLDLNNRASTNDQRLGARLSLPRFSDHFVFFVDSQRSDATVSGIALGDEVDVSGRAEGAGVYITGLPNWRNYTVNVRVSGQSEKQDVDSNIVVRGIQAQTTLRNRNVSVALLLSPVTPTFANGTNTYMSLGASYQRSRRTIVLNGQQQRSLSRYDQEYVPHLAAGIVYPFKRINLYASAEYEQSLALGLGVRLQLSKTGSP